MPEMIRAIYRAVTSNPEKVAKSIALGQTVETWTGLPGLHDEAVEAHRGEVSDIVEDGDGAFRLHIDIPVENTEFDIATVLVTLFGKPSFAGKLRLVDIVPGENLLASQPGPSVGIDGIRERVSATADQPLIMSIFKPCVGMSPQALAHLFEGQCRGGMDLVKDDEIMPDIASATTSQRINALRDVSDRVHQDTGRRTLYVVNLTGPVRELVDRAAAFIEAGAQALLLNVLVYSFDILKELAEDTRITVPVMAHPALTGALCGTPDTGLSYGLILGRLMRWAGADIVLFPAQYGSHAIPATEADAIRERLTEDAGHLKRAFPGPSAGVHPGMTEAILRDYGRDVIINAGGGVQGHPQGGEAGARAMRQSVEWVTGGNSLRSELPGDFAELKAALETWGVV